ncbi:MAG TPA: carboxypeptidase M32 [Clostridiales bacterium]|nr:carboxypeptidase M32 [Clostridiales bacterium]
MYSVIHEGGHALYELGSGDEYEGTCLSGGVSMGVHESQSRLFENQIGRSREYMELIFPKLRGLFLEQFADVGPHGVWLAVNKSQP